MVIIITKVKKNERETKVLSERGSQALVDAIHNELETGGDYMPSYEEDPEGHDAQATYLNDLNEVDEFFMEE